MRRGRCAKYGRYWKLKTRKRRFTQATVAHTTHIGASLAISGRAATCDEPAETRSDMRMASGMLMPLFTIATPATRPQAAMPMVMGPQSRMPSRNFGRRAVASALRCARAMLTMRPSPSMRL